MTLLWKVLVERVPCNSSTGCHLRKDSSSAAGTRIWARPAPSVYELRHPETTILYRIVQQHLETCIGLAGEADWDGGQMPADVERAFWRYLECGILAYGWAHPRCRAWVHDFLAPFSCKGRGVYPCCSTRRMVEAAAQLADHVLPRQPVSLWVLSLPKWLRYHLRHHPGAVDGALGILFHAIEGHLRTRSPTAGAQGRPGPARQP